MSLINPTLLTSNSANFQITVLPKGLSEPQKLTITLSAAATKGATSLSVAITAPTGITLGSTTIMNGTYILSGGSTPQIVVIDGNQLATVTSLAVDPLTQPLASGAVLTTYANSVVAIGLEGANLQLSKEVNQVVLLLAKGWSNKDYSTGSWQFSGNLMIPVNPLYAVAANLIQDALINEKIVYVERFLSNGAYFAGIAIVTDCSDTVTGNQYVSQTVTFQGTGQPIQKQLQLAA